MSVPSETELPTTVFRPLMGATLALILSLIALGLWAGLAPLATTIRASGTLASAAPRYDVQHPFGGRIAQVAVKKQMAIAKGQLLLALDVSLQRKNLEIVEQQIEVMDVENENIRRILAMNAQEIDQGGGVGLAPRYGEMIVQLRNEVRAALASESAAYNRAGAIEDGIGVLNQRVATLQRRSDQMKDLVAKGIVAATQSEAQVDILLSVRSQIKAQRADALQFADQSKQARMTAQNLKTKFRVSLLSQLSSNETQLPQLKRQAVNLRAEIASSEVRSPIDGTVLALDFDTQGMYAPRGTTLMSLSQNLVDPRASFSIPSQAIDQVFVGMEGVLTIPSLPQRNLPKIRVTLDAIAPEATRDRDGNVTGYAAFASIYPEDMDAAVSAMEGNLRLATDMPVSIALEGRKVTFARYLFSPFFAMFKGALQD